MLKKLSSRRLTLVALLVTQNVIIGVAMLFPAAGMGMLQIAVLAVLSLLATTAALYMMWPLRTPSADRSPQLDDNVPKPKLRTIDNDGLGELSENVVPPQPAKINHQELEALRSKA